MSATKQTFIDRYHAISSNKYDGWFIPNGILEIGRALGPSIVKNILRGCLPPIPVPDRNGDFNRVIDAMERENLVSVKELTLEDVTEPGTSVFALSYRHIESATKRLPRRRMNDEQKHTLSRAIANIATQRKSKRVILWFDQAMGQRNPKTERDWVRHGILPYFAFDILILKQHYDLARCWIFLERMIAEKCSNPENQYSGAVLLAKSYKSGTISPVQEVASVVLGGALTDKGAYNQDDKEQIRRWAAKLLLQEDANGDKYANLLGGNEWGSRKYDAKGLKNVVMNHLLPRGEIKWQDLSNSNTNGRFHGLSELLGLPDGETTSDTLENVRREMRRMEDLYMFHVFSASSEKHSALKATAIGCFHRSGRASRTFVCALNSIENCEETRVLESCILDCNEIVDPGACSFISACVRLGEDKELGTLHTMRRHEDSPLTRDAKAKLEARHNVLLQKIFEWKWFRDTLDQKRITLNCYMRSIQAGDVQWS